MESGIRLRRPGRPTIEAVASRKSTKLSDFRSLASVEEEVEAAGVVLVPDSKGGFQGVKQQRANSFAACLWVREGQSSWRRRRG